MANGSEHMPNKSEGLLPSPLPSDEEKLSVAVSEVLRLFRLHQAGHLHLQPWTKVKISTVEHKQLWSRLESHEDLKAHVTHKPRHDYSFDTQTLTIRMPTGLHESFLRRVEHDIWSQIQAIADRLHGARASVAQQIVTRGSTDLYQFPSQSEGGSRRSYTCGEQSLARRMDRDMWNPNESCRSRFAARMELTSPAISSCTCGILQSQTSSVTSPRSDLAYQIAIPYTRLAQYLRKAEAWYERVKHQGALDEPSGLVMRERKRTPAEQLRSTEEEGHPEAHSEWEEGSLVQVESRELRRSERTSEI
ncbi:MAG: hypothetical protein M1816_002335 [Peltula sp. TS41687]|nr:MAG: hypothetical protein M1816_002335 [Peltula sp. TS41687]